MRKTCLRVVLMLLTTVLSTLFSFQAQAQLSYSYTFAATGTSGWTGQGSRTTVAACATTGSIRFNLYSSAPTMNFVSPALNSSQGALVTLSYQTKCVNFSSTATGATANSVTTKVQYASSTSGPWTDVAGSSFGNTNSATCSTRTVTFTPPSGTFYVRFNSVWNAGDVYLYLDEISITAPAPSGCSSTPTPGNTLSSVVNACAGTNFTLSVQNPPSGSGITYQWESADDAAFTSNLVSLGTAAAQTTSQTSAKYYRCQVTCAGNGTGISTPVFVGLNLFYNCYAASAATNPADEEILGVSLNGYSNNSTCATLAPGPGSVLNQYSNY
ncbi:MAG: hypothetical protein FGM54_01865, partial [Chitinophagaceae bacterium]|nr:hypothetical protein [Chitinophagaceae bacterium]